MFSPEFLGGKKANLTTASRRKERMMKADINKINNTKTIERINKKVISLERSIKLQNC